MKLVVVGGSAQSTPQLAGAAQFAELVDDLELVLVARDASALAAVARAMTQLALPKRLVPRLCDARSDLARALASADVVLLQARYGGYAGRAFDEGFPLRHGIPGDEGLGPGGLAAAWRSWPHVERLLALVAAAAPGATVVCLTAPLGILTRCALHHRPALRFVGSCELPLVTLRAVCDRVGVDWREATFRYAGVNHLGWFDAIGWHGADLVERYAAARAGDDFPSGDAVAAWGAVPLKYVRLHQAPERVVAEQRRAPPRAAVLEAVRAASLEAFAHGGPAAIRAALQRRPAPWYEAAVAPLLAALAGRSTETPLFLTTVNGDYLPELPADAVLEVPHTARAGSLVPLQRDRGLPPAIRTEIAALAEYERLAAAAVTARSPRLLGAALAAHPWVRSPQAVPALVADVVAGSAGAVAAAPVA